MAQWRCIRRGPAFDGRGARRIRRLNNPPVVAVGRDGMDLCTGRAGSTAAPDSDVQRGAFAWHIDLTKRTGKPLMIHNQDADVRGRGAAGGGRTGDGDLPLISPPDRRWPEPAWMPAGCSACRHGQLQNAHEVRRRPPTDPSRAAAGGTDAPFLLRTRSVVRPTTSTTCPTPCAPRPGCWTVRRGRSPRIRRRQPAGSTDSTKDRLRSTQEGLPGSPDLVTFL